MTGIVTSWPSSTASEDDLTQLGTHELNGRQIKNAVKLAQRLALKRKTTGLDRLSIDTALEIELIEREWQNPDLNTSQSVSLLRRRKKGRWLR